MIPKKANELVLAARKALGKNQKEFAQIFKKTQGEISKYEREKISPPADICMQCVHILLGKREKVEDSSVEAIIDRLKSGFDAPEHAFTRRLIMDILRLESDKCRFYD